MRLFWVQLMLLVAAAASATALSYLPRDGELYLIAVPMGICVLFGWILVFENHGMRRARGWKEHLLLGSLVPVPSNWRKSVSLSFAAQACLLSAAVVFGAVIRMLWSAYA